MSTAATNQSHVHSSTFGKTTSSELSSFSPRQKVTNILPNSWDDDADAVKSTNLFPLRVEQLAFRHHEVYSTYNTFRDFIHGTPGVHMDTIDGSLFDRSSWGVSVDDPETSALVQCDEDVILAGHSFGGATVVSSNINFNHKQLSLTIM